MADELDALLDTAVGDTPETPDPAALPDSQADDAAAQAAAIKLAELDAVVPEDPSIDKSYWGRPLKDVIRVADQHKQEAGQAATRNQERNRLLQAKWEAEQAAAYWQQQASGQGGQQPPTEEQRLQRLAERPVPEIQGMVDERLSPLQQQLVETQRQLVHMASESARERARAHLNIAPEAWEAATPQMASYIAYNGWDTRDPRVWAYAGEQWRAAAAAWTPQAAQAPAAEVPRAGAPPVGGARSQVRPAAQPQLKGPMRDLVSGLSEAFELDDKHKKDFESDVAQMRI